MTNFKFIVLEGLDCSGKTTLARELVKRMSPATILQFPDRTTKTGVIINKYLQKDKETLETMDVHELHLLYSANRYEKANFIRKALLTGNVICDRYWLSGAVYSTAKGLDFEWCKSVDKFLPKPDATFFLDVDENVVAQRKGFGDEEHDKIEFQKKVYNIYKSLTEQENIILIDGSMDLEAKISFILEKIK